MANNRTKASKETKAKAARSRLRQLLAFDAEIAAQPSLMGGLFGEDAGSLIGIDEVGRGCLAGPVVAAAVRLPLLKPRSRLAQSMARLDDSKMLTASEREELDEVIRSVAVWAVAEASVEEIDSLNILKASLLAMRRARERLAVEAPSVVLIDGPHPVPGIADRQHAVVQGDSRSASIAAASIVAKVYRDRLMCRLSERYPEYLWHQNKGYPSPEHRRAIARAGLTEWHRRTFSWQKVGEQEESGP